MSSHGGDAWRESAACGARAAARGVGTWTAAGRGAAGFSAAGWAAGFTAAAPARPRSDDTRIPALRNTSSAAAALRNAPPDARRAQAAQRAASVRPAQPLVTSLRNGSRRLGFLADRRRLIAGRLRLRCCGRLRLRRFDDWRVNRGRRGSFDGSRFHGRPVCFVAGLHRRRTHNRCRGRCRGNSLRPHCFGRCSRYRLRRSGRCRRHARAGTARGADGWPTGALPAATAGSNASIRSSVIVKPAYSSGARPSSARPTVAI